MEKQVKVVGSWFSQRKGLSVHILASSASSFRFIELRPSMPFTAHDDAKVRNVSHTRLGRSQHGPVRGSRLRLGRPARDSSQGTTPV
eukprot:7581803-Alexandrium_andersonii.AAC.1